jgi:hypothetical protein
MKRRSVVYNKPDNERSTPSGVANYGVSPEALSAVMDAFGLTPRRMTTMVGSPLNRIGERTIRRWRTPGRGGMPVDIFDRLLHWLYSESYWPEHREAVARLSAEFGNDFRGRPWWNERMRNAV